MPELPDIVLYLHALAPRIGHAPLERLRIASPFVLPSTDPTPTEVEGRRIRRVKVSPEPQTDASSLEIDSR